MYTRFTRSTDLRGVARFARRLMRALTAPRPKGHIPLGRMISPHAPRHYAATSILKETGDLELVPVLKEGDEWVSII